MLPQFIFVVLLAYGIQAQVLILGECPDISVVHNFDTSRFSGNWIVMEEFSSIFDLGMRCLEMEFSASSNESLVLHSRMIGDLTQLTHKVEGHAEPDGAIGDAKFIMYYTSPNPYNEPYWVLDTDYDSYAVVWSCSESYFTNLQLAWILTRNRDDDEALNKAHAAFKQNKLKRSFLRYVDQDDCPENN